ncbi:hypothetical protein [Streptomyces collinus]|uniref:hypothetical protein n=1 Tax=Streptomyces collinus TaxID=42684 RepID=UPI0036E17732
MGRPTCRKSIHEHLLISARKWARTAVEAYLEEPIDQGRRLLAFTARDTRHRMSIPVHRIVGLTGDRDRRSHTLLWEEYAPPAAGQYGYSMWIGAVDGLRINRTLYDFEAEGVRTRRAD